MPWFRIDDGWHGHPKVIAAGNAAAGLWARCGAYCAQQLTEGKVPAAIARGYGSKREIDRLTEVGLWVPIEGGYLIPDFLDYNPSAEKVKTDRAAAAERQRKHRESQRDIQRESHDPVPSRPVPVDSTLPSSSSQLPAADDDGLFATALELLVEAKAVMNPPRSRNRSWDMTTRTNAIAEDGQRLRRLLADRSTIDAVAAVIGQRNAVVLAACKLNIEVPA